MAKTISVFLATLLLAASCTEQVQSGRETIDYVLSIAGSPDSPEHSLLAGKSKLTPDGDIYIMGSPESCALLGESFKECDRFDNVRARRTPDGLKDFSGETFSLMCDPEYTPYAEFANTAGSRSMRELMARMAVASLDDKCNVSIYDLEGNAPKRPAKMIILSDPWMLLDGKFDIDTLFALTSCKVPVISPQELLFDAVFGGDKKYFNIGLMCDSLYSGTGVYEELFRQKVAQHGLMEAKYFEAATPQDTLHRLASFLDAYIESGRTEPLDVLLVDDWSVDQKDLLDELALIRDYSKEESMRYGKTVAPDFTVICSSGLTMGTCYLQLRQSSLFTHRIALPELKSYTLRPLPGGSLLQFLMIPSENVQN
ncbi:MAG: hypothetical protein J6O51_10330 [Bacteroidales bacterium]|nr:hypothetical protein [Bacteroidales bacterium]